MAAWQIEYFGDRLVTKEGEKSTADALAGKDLIGIYFSAHWCPPCRGFTPVLAEFFDQAQEEGKNFTIVFASSDSDQHSFDEYYGSMPWVAVPFSASAKTQALGSKFGVRGIPALFILDKFGNVKDTDGRSTVSSAKGNVDKAMAKWA